jgi:hypothetical protein
MEAAVEGEEELAMSFQPSAVGFQQRPMGLRLYQLSAES